jgi:predicted nucleic acid-binding protein
VRLFLDADIAFSAALSDGAVRRLLYDLIDKDHTLVMDSYVWEEAGRNLLVYRAAAIENLHRLSLHIEIAGTVKSRLPRETVLEEFPEKDLPVISSAVEHKCSILITGDKLHFGRYYGKRIAGVTILSPTEAAERFIRDG